MERDSSAKFWFERQLLYIADRRRQKKLEDEEAKGDLWINLQKEYADAMLDVVLQKAEMLGRCGLKPWRFFVYVLVQDIPSAERRVRALRDAGMNPFAQPYRDFEKNTEPSAEAKAFARWVNNKAIFKSADTFAEYSTSIRGHNAEREEAKIE